ncbi:MAG: M23 family metallopeptidase [Candidatus Binatia bacterium]
MRLGGFGGLVLAAVAATSTAAITPAASPAPAPTPVVSDVDRQELRERALVFPVPQISPDTVRDTYHDRRAGHAHEALDISAPRGAPVVAVDSGVVTKLFRSVPGGLTIYLVDERRRYAYYYAHLDAYAAELAEGQRVARGQVIGYVGSTGNAAPDAPHLHFAIFKLEPEARWWHGTPLDPHPLLVPSR